ncbi:DUF2291 family protein [Lichenihabitans sp. Uapishka_5]|uniref:DUF2291 family protein n=1 Tax=Lichenihabitans sp. Uapishka_5 TaxID=3037302 RepID=UPI0029E813C7|nr:DUF2291 family protein [Lichenihabitans sp. Uapishka_5]MDX7953114.1 DUF2291 family protein [Lichenihabitans sp. Uapishka_5]
MSQSAATRPKAPARARSRTAIGAVAAIVLVGVMAYDTKVVRIGADGGGPPGAFVPAEFGRTEFPKVQAAVAAKAVDAVTLATALAKDPAAAAKQYGVQAPGGDAYAYPVTLTGTAGKSDLGVYDLQVPGLPDGFKVQVQTGPAINGTALRDVPGTVKFGQFTNQIEYQNAGSALNKEMKKQVLSKIDTANLTGKTLSVVGAFETSDPKAWLVTPTKVVVQ